QDEGMIRLVDRVSAESRDAALYHSFVLFRGTRRSAVGGEFGDNIAHDERNIAPVAPEYREARRIRAECRSPFAIRGNGVGRDIGPTCHDLLFERLLLAEGGTRKDRKPQARDCTQTQNAKTIHRFLLLNRGGDAKPSRVWVPGSVSRSRGARWISFFCA